MTDGPARVLAPAIESVTADDRAGMHGWFALMVACHDHDSPALPPPCPLSHANRFSWPGFGQRAWIVRDGTTVVGAAHMVLPEHDDPDYGFAHVLVVPPWRRRGLGTRLLEHLAAQARAAGRARLFLDVGEPLDGPGPGAALLRSVGARVGMVETRRRLVLRPQDPQTVHHLTAAARAAARGYRLVQWTGPTPPEWRVDLAALIARMSTDAPTGELTVPPRRWDADRVRERDGARLANGVRSVVTAAQAVDGHLVAYTEALTCVEEDGFADQSDTLVAPAHRGRRLGLWIKLANLELLVSEHPEVRAIDTFNADDNRWMIAINEAMGFVPLLRVRDWELDLTAGQAGTTAPISAAASGP
jgi:GNAT superfamily N-acetyltransferase